jgi:hypothetical protein
VHGEVSKSLRHVIRQQITSDCHLVAACHISTLWARSSRVNSARRAGHRARETSLLPFA